MGTEIFQFRPLGPEKYAIKPFFGALKSWLIALQFYSQVVCRNFSLLFHQMLSLHKVVVTVMTVAVIVVVVVVVQMQTPLKS